MRKLVCLMGLLFLMGVSASAQDNPKVDVFGGYSFLLYRPNIPNFSNINYNGGVGSVAINLNSWIAGVAEVAGYHASTITYNGAAAPGASSNAVSYLFGPKIYMNTGKITPFGQVLFGGAHGDATSGSGTTVSANTFAMALGGGVDWNATQHISVRLAQVEYLMTRYGSTTVNSIGYGGTGTQNSFRYSGGVVLRF